MQVPIDYLIYIKGVEVLRVCQLEHYEIRFSVYIIPLLMRIIHESIVCLQRQKVESVPVVECDFIWKLDVDGKLWIYGRDHDVFAPSYPQKYCWGCCIL